MTVIHISFDFPDKIDSKKTKAVKNLVNSQNTENIIFSLNRTATKLNKTGILKEDHGYTLYVWGLPYGVFLYFWMFIAYRRILKVIRNENIKPDLIHAHKLASEGIIGYLLSKKLKVPLLSSVRSSDLHVLKYKKGYHKIYSAIISHATRLIFIAPWAVKALQNYIGEGSLKNKYEVLPNIIHLNIHNDFAHSASKKFVSVLHLKYLKAKNIKRLIMAFDQIFDNYPDYTLDIVGDGPRRADVLNLLRKTKNSNNFIMRGEIEHSLLIKNYADYLGLVLPSYPETFGMVYIEALSAGIPVIYSLNAGIDGYFNDFQIGVAVNHRSVEDIAAAIEEVIKNSNKYKQNIENMILTGYLDKFSKAAISERYSNILQQATGTNLTYVKK